MPPNFGNTAPSFPSPASQPISQNAAVPKLSSPVAQAKAITQQPIATNPVKRTKISKNLLNEVMEQVSQQSMQEVKVVDLNQPNIDLLFEDFKIFVRDELQKATAVQQLSMASCKFIEPNEIQLVCSSEMNKIMVNTQKDAFLDFAKNYTKQPTIRISVAIDDSVQVEAPVYQKTKSKIEIFEEMAAKNPAIMYLKRQLNMMVE